MSESRRRPKNGARSRYNKSHHGAAALERLEERRLLSLPTVFAPVGYGGTGTSYWPMVNPRNASEIYLGSDMGEEWHTTDGGTTWTTMNVMTQIGANQAMSSVQYGNAIGTAYAIDNYVLEKTTDGGTTWTRPAGWAGTSGYGAYQVLADANSGKLLVVEEKWNYRGFPDATTWLYKVWFSGDGGASFSQIPVASHDSPDNNLYRCQLAGAFWDGDKIYFATNFGLYNSGDGGANWSTSTIGGINSANEGFYSFAGSRSGSTTRLYGVTWSQDGFTGNYIPVLGNAVIDYYRGLYSVDIGQPNWISRAGTFWGAGSTYNLYPRYVQMADGDINKVWIGGGDANNYNVPIVYRADDGGVSGTWTRLLKTGYGSWLSVDGAPNANIKTHQIGMDPTQHLYDWGYGGDTATFTVLRNNPNILTFSDGGDAFISTDGGAHWKALMAPEDQLSPEGQYTELHRRYSSTINETNVYNMAWADPLNMVAPCTDFTAMQSNDGGSSWLSPTYNTGTYANTYYDAVYDWRTGVFYAISSHKHDLYHDAYTDGIEGWPFNYLVASYDRGLTWNQIHDFGTGSTAKALALDPTRPGRLYVGLVNHTDGVGGIFYTDNLNSGSASTWTRMPNQPMRGGTFSGMHPEELKVLDNGDLVAVFAPRADDSYTFRKNSGIWLLPGGNVSNTWLDRSGNLATNGNNPDNRIPFWTMGLSVDPNDPTQNTWFATTIKDGSGWYNWTAMYKSTDRGLTWSRWGYVDDSTAPYDLPNGQVWKLIIKPGTTEMFLGMKSTGLFYCADYTAATPVFQQTNMPFWCVNNLAINPYNPDELWIATFGAGLFKANIGTTVSRPAAITDLSAHCDSGAFTVNWSDIAGESGYHLQYSDGTRKGTSNSEMVWTTVDLAANTTTWSSSSLTGGVPIYFRVMGYNSSNVDAPVSNIASTASFAAITNVAAEGKGSSQAVITWTDNAVGEEGFEIQRSTNGVNWEFAGTAPANATGVSLNGMAVNTQYYLRVRAVTSNAQGAWSSAAIARTNSLAGLLAYEDFSYSPGLLGPGATLGIGWAGPWVLGNRYTAAQVLAGSLTSSGASSLWTAGNRLTVTLDDTVSRNTASPVGGSDTLWASYLLKVSYNPSTSSMGGYVIIDGISFGVCWDGRYNVTDGSFYANSSVLAADGATALLVMEVISNTTPGNDTVNLYLNPTPGATTPGTPIATSAVVPHKTGSSLVQLAHGYYASPNFDELRIGRDYMDVAPITVPATPTNLAASEVSSTQITLSWTDMATNELGYHVERSTDGLSYSVVQTLGADAASWSDPTLSMGATYRYRVSSYNGTGDSINSTVVTVNRTPIDIALSASSIPENQSVGTAVGTFSTTDPDAGNTSAYSLVSGTGSTDNGSFTISGDRLLAAASFNYEAKSTYTIRVRTTDQGGLWYEKVFTINVTDVDEIAPTVTAVYVRGSTWASGYLAFLAANTSGSSSTYGYAIPVGSGSTQLQTLPWRNLNRISIAFSEDVSIAQAQFAIVGTVGSYTVSGFSYNSTDHVATWSLSAAIGPDKLYVAVPGSSNTPVTDAAGNILDGEWTNPTSYGQVGPTSSFPSGNGTAGGNFAFRFDVLPGDSTGGSLGKVNVADVAQTKSRSSLAVSLSTYRSDFDGNNLVNVADVAYVKSRSSIYSLPTNPPVLPVFGPVFSQVSVLLSRKYLLLGYV